MIGWPSHAGLALANTVATLLEMVALLLLVRRRLNGLEGRRTMVAFAKGGVAALVMGIVLLAWQAMLRGKGALVLGSGGILLGSAVYFGATVLLRAEEPQAVWMLLRRRQRAPGQGGLKSA